MPVKLTPKQKEIVKLMRQGFPLMIGQSDFTGKNYYMIASTHNKGFGNTYMRADVFANLLSKGIIYFDNTECEYFLTNIGKTIKL